ncbi:MAG TPA: hypothetical protein VIS72_11295, partial [Anaerolineales bacterium]
QWAEFMIEKVRRWQPEREMTVVGDGSYAVIVLVQRCQRLKKPVQLVSRLRLDARLFDFPGSQSKSKRGPKPQKGIDHRGVVVLCPVISKKGAEAPGNTELPEDFPPFPDTF